MSVRDIKLVVGYVQSGKCRRYDKKCNRILVPTRYNRYVSSFEEQEGTSSYPVKMYIYKDSVRKYIYWFVERFNRLRLNVYCTDHLDLWYLNLCSEGLGDKAFLKRDLS